LKISRPRLTFYRLRYLNLGHEIKNGQDCFSNIFKVLVKN